MALQKIAPPKSVFFLMYVPVVLVFALIIAIKYKTGLRTIYFINDPVTTMRAPNYVGLVSNLGVLLWCAAAAVCLFTAAIMPREAKEDRRFYLCSGLLTSLFLFDDFFLLHEQVWIWLLRLSDRKVAVIYTMILVAYLFRFQKKIMRTEFVLLVLAMGFLYFSFAWDFVNERMDIVIPEDAWLWRDWLNDGLLEDGPKSFGIVTWFTYFVRTGAAEFKTSLRRP